MTEPAAKPLGLHPRSIMIETITPAIARRMLEFNLGNRRRSPNRISAYARDMAADRWPLTGAAIVFAANGCLLDGQNRLYACIEANVSFVTVVVRGVDDAAMANIDTGKSRTAGDLLRWDGVTDATQVASMVGILIAYQAGELRNGHWLNTNVTRAVLREFVAANRPLVEWATVEGRRLRKIGAILSSGAAFAYIARELTDVEIVVDFIDQIVRGVALRDGDPVLALRNWFVNPRNRRTRETHLSALIRAWNADVAGQRLQVIRPWIPGQPFPVMETP